MISRNSDKLIPAVPNGARHLTPESVLQSAEDAVESARGFTNDSLDRAGAAMRDVRANLGSSAGEISARARELARRGISAASHTSERAHKTLNQYANVTGRYVADQPVKSVLIAAAVGAALAALVIAARNRD
ncbi:MAG: hypothetical protein V4757_19400 [Pseudomonadota bacterium]